MASENDLQTSDLSINFNIIEVEELNGTDAN